MQIMVKGRYLGRSDFTYREKDTGIQKSRKQYTVFTEDNEAVTVGLQDEQVPILPNELDTAVFTINHKVSNGRVYMNHVSFEHSKQPAKV